MVPLVLLESTASERHLLDGLPDPLPEERLMCRTVVWNATWRTTPRSDEALAFTRCSVLKVRRARDSRGHDVLMPGEVRADR
jgi:hypothetical protein